MDPKKPGKTIWEMLCERLRHSSGNGSGIAFANPLDLRVGGKQPVSYANGPEFANYDFSVSEIREYTRHIGGKDFQFTDYLLHGVNTKSFDANAALDPKLRAVPNQAGSHDTLLLKVYDEFAFSEDFLGVLKDDTGVFEVTDDATGAKETFTRINDVRDSYHAAVMAVTATTPEGKATPGKINPLKIEYWDYWRDVDIGDGNKAREFVFVEMNSDTGWFQIWRGREFFS